jgi:hypothetical protein
VDWETLLTTGSASQLVTHLSVRGKNLSFATRLSEILQLNELPHKVTWLDIKRAMTPTAVRDIHEAVAVLWPTADDLDRVLLSQQERQSALYIGDYQPQPLARAVARHSLYSDTVLVVDPIHHPSSLRPKFNPVVNPGEHRSNTLVALRSWWLLFPWIEADIVRVIHLPGDFNSSLARAGYEAADARAKASPELQEILRAETEAQLKNFQEYREHVELSLPDEEFDRRFREYKPDITADEIAALFSEIRRRRDNHPFFVEPLPVSGATGEFLSFGVGANYDMAKLVAARTKAHLVTDQQYRWKEIELDRELSGTDRHNWSAFAKALHATPLRFLDTADLALATKLRAEQRLADLRLFFRKVWNSLSADDSFSDSRATDLAAELNERVGEAEASWASLDHELLKWFSGEGIAAAGAVISGHAALLPAALGFAGAAAANVIYSTVKRHSFTKHHPAAFFIGRR